MRENSIYIEISLKWISKGYQLVKQIHVIPRLNNNLNMNCNKNMALYKEI